jgi:hypothetical protein
MCIILSIWSGGMNQSTVFNITKKSNSDKRKTGCNSLSSQISRCVELKQIDKGWSWHSKRKWVYDDVLYRITPSKNIVYN